jgi:hypothetical protein
VSSKFTGGSVFTTYYVLNYLKRGSNSCASIEEKQSCMYNKSQDQLEGIKLVPSIHISQVHRIPPEPKMKAREKKENPIVVS